MTEDDVIRMAREAGWGFGNSRDSDFVKAQLRFAELVAAAEREAIAQMIEDAPPLVEFVTNEQGGCLVCGFTPKLAALTIRERGAP